MTCGPINFEQHPFKFSITLVGDDCEYFKMRINKICEITVRGPFSVVYIANV